MTHFPGGTPYCMLSSTSCFNINYNHKNLVGDTALKVACETKKKKVALKLSEKEDINYNNISVEYYEI